MSLVWAMARLKPVEPTLARLFETTSSWRWLASMPLTAMRCETSMLSLLRLTQFVDGALQRLVLHLQQSLIGLVRPDQVHRGDDRLGHVDVGAFDVALVDLGAVDRCRQRAVR